MDHCEGRPGAGDPFVVAGVEIREIVGDRIEDSKIVAR